MVQNLKLNGMNKNKVENPPVFACAAGEDFLQEGISLRDYFAAKAIQGLCAGRTKYEQPGADAKLAYELADHMLNERVKEK